MHIVLFSPKKWKFSESFESSSNRVTKLNGDLESLTQQVTTQHPDVVFVGGFEESDELLTNLKSLCDAIPQAIVVLFLEQSDSDFLIKAMRAGVREVLASNTTEEMTGAVNRAKSHLKSTDNNNDHHKAQKIGFMSAKGGDGGTCVVANVATALAKNEQLRVLAIDLSLQYGDVEIYLTNKSITNDLADFSCAVDRLDKTLLDLMVHHVNDNLHLIPSPSSLEKILRVAADDVEKLIDIIESHYDYVLIDIGTGLDPISLRVWDKLDKLILVSTMSIASARRTSQLLRLWENMGYSAKKAFILISRFGGPSDLQAVDYEKAVGKKIWRTVYREYMGIQESLLKGTPVVDLKPNTKFTHSILDLASEWTGKPIKRKSSIWAYLGIK
jgi:pilus assembly protein CpaE